MRRLVFLVGGLSLCFTIGCPERKFNIVMQRAPDGGVQRELTVWTADSGKISGPREDVLAAAGAAYGGAVTHPDGKHRFSGTFTEGLPADLVHDGLANHGLFVASKSRLGSVFAYVERMPGRTDLVELVTIGEKAADTIARALAAWARKQPELQSHPEKLERLVTFLEVELRRDLLNVLLMGWQAMTRANALEEVKTDDAALEEYFWQTEVGRIASFLIERGYLRPSEIACLTDEFEPVIRRGVIRKAAQAMGYGPDEPPPAVLARLSDSTALEAAGDEGLAAIGVSEEEFDQLLSPAIPAIFGTRTSGDVTWRGISRPLQTNGAWNDETGELTWEARARQGCETPQLLLAVWAEPDKAYQREHLGRVVLDGESLYEYAGWRAALTSKQQAEWDAFVESLRPGPGLPERIEQFRLAARPSPPTTAPATQPSEPPRGAALILQGLQPGEAEGGE
jgi:hypothetical protein